MAKEAKIKCPHCGMPIRVRQKTVADTIADDFTATLDSVWKAIDDTFKKIFK